MENVIFKNIYIFSKTIKKTLSVHIKHKYFNKALHLFHYSEPKKIKNKNKKIKKTRTEMPL